MEKEKIERWVKERKLISKSYDSGQIVSLLEKIERNMRVALAIPLSEESADVFFSQAYESLRQLGDVFWWERGYEPQYHDTSLELLKEAECLTPEQKVQLQSLSRLKDIRNDSHYRGMSALHAQAETIKELWEKAGSAILLYLKKKYAKKNNAVQPKHGGN